MSTTTQSIPKWRENVRKILQGTISGLDKSTTRAVESLLEMFVGLVIVGFVFALSEWVQQFPTEEVILSLFIFGVMLSTLRRVIQRFDEHYTVDEIGVKTAMINDAVEIIKSDVSLLHENVTQIYLMLPDPAEETDVPDERIASIAS